MNSQENRESDNQQPAIEDLTVNKDEEADVKGGGWGSSNYQYAFDLPYRY